MQQLSTGQFRYSPSDLVTFLECHHASLLDIKSLTEKLDRKKGSPVERLLRQKGLEHEAAYLQHLKNEGMNIREIPGDRSLEERVELTVEAMYSGAEVIYQASFLQEPWRGHADFLLKCETPSGLGNHSYEVLDTKLAQSARPKHIIQLCTYSELLAGIQGLHPASMHLFSGAGEKHSFKVSDFFAYYTRARQRFETYVRNLPQDPYPEPCSHCTFCPWQVHCTSRWETDDHLSRIAGIRRSQINKLHKAGIETAAQLAATPSDVKVPDLNRDAFLRLRSQASLQADKTATGKDSFEIVPCPADRGFARIPIPDEGDLFFDMEGNPLHPGGLEYLFGVHYKPDSKEPFKLFWAHTHEEEKAAFKHFMGFLSQHLEKYTNAHIYHYGHYETTALKRLGGRYATCEEQLDDLLRAQKFVDLYQVVREGIRTSEPGYSIKNLEAFYMDGRNDTVATATDSVIVYNQWRETGEDALLQEIAEYNKTDCISTRLLRNWLLALKPDDTPWFGELPEHAQATEAQRKDREISHEELLTRLDRQKNESPAIFRRLSHLLEFHSREAKPQWWSRFERQNKFEDELVDDTECLGGLQRIGHPEVDGYYFIHTFRFPPQEYKLRAGNSVVNAASMKPAGTIVELDEKRCIARIRCSASMDPLPSRFSAGPPGPINSQGIRSAMYRYAERVSSNPGQAHAAADLLNRQLPRIRGKAPGEPVAASQDVQAAALQAVAGLDNSYLFIQGPPGSGKTYISGHIIVELIRHGKKIGITSNSHKAIHHLLKHVEDIAAGKGVHFHGVKKATRGTAESLFNGQFIFNETRTDNIDLGASLFAGTAWLFSHQHMQGLLDYLFIDEAGQVSTANVVAMATSARNIVLVGDQMQLGQPIQGIHPGEAGLSVLEFLLGEHSTIAPERGIFLDRTYRLNPNICRFISDAFYDGHLVPHENTARQSLDLRDTDLPNEGIVMIAAEHQGCSQKSAEEGRIIQTRYQQLLGQSLRDQTGCTRPISEDDILVITPYNVQVNHLRSLLPGNARVATVDKFQGQEAPIVFISMVTSSAEDLPRNVEFLYSKNRLNVAISRAQCLAVVVANPRLLEISCQTVEQMKLANTLCRLNEYATAL